MLESSRIATLAVAIPLLSLFGAGAGQAGEVARQGTFQANWKLDGTTESVELDGKLMSVYRLGGPVDVRRSDGLAAEFESACSGVSDEKTGGMARCTWTDGDGDVIFLRFTGRIIGSTGTTREAEGTILGGLGKYEGLEGSIHTEWFFWESHLDEGTIIAHNTETTGSWTIP